MISRYERDYVVPGDPYAGFDLHTAEIVGFYLDRWNIVHVMPHQLFILCLVCWDFV